MPLSRTETFRLKPISDGLDTFRDDFSRFCRNTGIKRPFDVTQLENNEEFKNQLVYLILTLQNLPAASDLPSITGRGTFRNDLRRFISTVNSDTFDTTQVFPLLNAVLDGKGNENIWDAVSAALTQTTPPPIVPLFDQTPYVQTTSSFVNSSEQRRHVDAVLKEELDSIYIGLQDFYEVYFGSTENLGQVAAAVFRRCQQGQDPLFSEATGWQNWPESSEERNVFHWLCSATDLFRRLAEEEGFALMANRTVLAQPNRPLPGSRADRKLSVGIFSQPDDGNQSNYHWSHVLVPGELKSNPNEDTSSTTWRDLGRYAREVLTLQDTRRFSLGFKLCGPIMRLWEFDRLGTIASLPFDINQDGLRFVQCILAFLLMDREHLGYDTSIHTADGKRFIEITRNGQLERIILDKLMKRSPCVAGRATTCWKAYSEEDNSPLVVKDSWQYPEREDEGNLLREATDQGVINVARYYYHETVHIGTEADDIRHNVRGGLDISQATNYRLIDSDVTADSAANKSRTGPI